MERRDSREAAGLHDAAARGSAVEGFAIGLTRTRRRYGVQASGAGYLLRPDQHVCARWLTLDATRLQAALDTVLPQ